MLCLLEAGTCTDQHKLQMIVYILSEQSRAFGGCAAMRRHMRKRNHTDSQIQEKFKRCKKPQTQEMSREEGGGKK